MSNKYNIPDLAILAQDKFRSQIQGSKTNILLETIDIVSSMLPDTFPKFRDVAVAECVERADDLAPQKEFTALLSRYPELGAAFVRDCVQRKAYEIAQLKQKLALERRRCADLEDELEEGRKGQDSDDYWQSWKSWK